MPKLPSFEGASKLLVPLVAGVLVLGGGGFFIIQQANELQQLRGRLEQNRQQLAQLDAQNQELTGQLDTVQNERKHLEERVASLRLELSRASADLDTSRATFGDLQERYDRAAQERTQLQTQLSNAMGERDEARKRLQRLEEDNTDLQRSAARLRERLTLLDRDYKQLSDKLAILAQQPNASLAVVSSVGPTATGTNVSSGQAVASAIPGTVELPPIIVRKDQAGMTFAVRGRIVEVSEPHNFVVVDKGSTDGVRVGTEFAIVRGANTVGRATVVRVRPQLSACDIVRAKTPGQLHVGDVAVQSGTSSP